MDIFEVYSSQDWEDALGELPVNYDAGTAELPWNFVFAETGFSPQDRIECGELTIKIGEHEVGSPVFVNSSTGQFAVMNPPPRISGAMLFEIQDADEIQMIVGSQSFVRLSGVALHQALHDLVVGVAEATLKKAFADSAAGQGADDDVFTQTGKEWNDATHALVHKLLAAFGVELPEEHEPTLGFEERVDLHDLRN